MVGVVFFSGMETMPPEGLCWALGVLQGLYGHAKSTSKAAACDSSAAPTPPSSASPISTITLQHSRLDSWIYTRSFLPYLHILHHHSRPLQRASPRPPATLTLCAASRQPHQRTTVSKHECYERLNRVTTPSRSQSVRYILMPVARIADTWPARRTAPSRID